MAPLSSALTERGSWLMEPGPAVQRMQSFAEEWYEAWNTHDLDRILRHYREDVTFRSPFVAAITGRQEGILLGRRELASYFERALLAYPDLRFEPLALFAEAHGLVLQYRSVDGLTAAEVMWLDRNLRVITAVAHYDRIL
jgi:hypothetical protein